MLVRQFQEISGHLPTKVGEAKIDFRDCRRPERIGDTIMIPFRKESEFFLLDNGRQFVIYFPRTICFPDEGIWFGGTDEQPFLVRLQPEILPILEEKGEKGFYQALKPEFIRKAENFFGRLSKRQGDIFAFDVQINPIDSGICPFKWLIFPTSFWGSKLVMLSPVTSHPVLDTRHCITGHYSIEPVIVGNIRYAFGEGVLEAPDHYPLELKEISLLVQTDYLFEPTEAD